MRGTKKKKQGYKKNSRGRVGGSASKHGKHSVEKRERTEGWRKKCILVGGEGIKKSEKIEKSQKKKPDTY